MSAMVHRSGHQIFGSFSFTHVEHTSALPKEVSTRALSSRGVELKVDDLQGMGIRV